MSTVARLEADRKKQLGQYFTHQRVGRLLAALADAASATTIIDPMVGSADLLLSCLAVGAEPKKLVGVDLDPIALSRARLALHGVTGVELTAGDAFTSPLPAEQFDLVITNPPYIRYQARGEVDGIRVPSGAQVREGLILAIESRSELASNDREAFLRAARRYPATSDIAVPAWILSAALVREGGMLAVVVPQTWLSRNYAQAVRQLLDEVFEVEVIVEDGDAGWFDDAQVRTQLVVARRRSASARFAGHSVVIARATAALANEGSLLGGLRSEHEVAAAVREVASQRAVAVTTGLVAHREEGLSVAAAGQAIALPARVAAEIGADSGGIVTRNLESYGWQTGQGFRSGANDFFYVTATQGVVRSAPRWGRRILDIPAECLLPAVRRQSDLSDRLSVSDDILSARVVNLRGWATGADAAKMDPADGVQILPAGVARWIAQVAVSPASAADQSRTFPELTAVATNSKTDRWGRPIRFWYQLPELAPRHRPAVLIGRVCGGRPTAYLNASRAVVDANFSSLWPTAPDAMAAEALIALLNSSWTWASLEATCTVLGGGALKVEATDLRRLLLPDLSPEHVLRLSVLGRSTAAGWSRDLLDAIDDVVAEAVAGHAGDLAGVHRLRRFAERALEHRSRKR